MSLRISLSCGSHCYNVTLILKKRNRCVCVITRLYYTKVRLGSPAREFNVQIDTGSDILWVTCSSCENCPRNSGLGVRPCISFCLFLVWEFQHFD